MEGFVSIEGNTQYNNHQFNTLGYLVKIPSAFLSIMKSGYINLFKHFIHDSLVPKVRNRFHFQGNSEVLITGIQAAIISQSSQSESVLKLLFRTILGN